MIWNGSSLFAICKLYRRSVYYSFIHCSQFAVHYRKRLSSKTLRKNLQNVLVDRWEEISAHKVYLIKLKHSQNISCYCYADDSSWTSQFIRQFLERTCDFLASIKLSSNCANSWRFLKQTNLIAQKKFCHSGDQNYLFKHKLNRSEIWNKEKRGGDGTTGMSREIIFMTIINLNSALANAHERAIFAFDFFPFDETIFVRFS